MRLYRRRAARADSFDRKLDELAIYSATLCPVVVWHTRLPTSFHWFMPGDFIAGLPPTAAMLAAAWFAVTACAFYARQAQLRLRGEPWALGKILLFTMTAGAWWGGIVVLANDFAFTVTNVVAHGVPYMLVSHGVARSQQRLDPQPRRAYLAALPVYLVALGVLAIGEEWLWDAWVWHEHAGLLATPALDLEQAAPLLIPLLSVPQLTHYLLDGFLWRLDGHNPRFPSGSQRCDSQLAIDANLLSALKVPEGRGDERSTCRFHVLAPYCCCRPCSPAQPKLSRPSLRALRLRAPLRAAQPRLQRPARCPEPWPSARPTTHLPLRAAPRFGLSRIPLAA